jgi:hypothetical protein
MGKLLVTLNKMNGVECAVELGDGIEADMQLKIDGYASSTGFVLQVLFYSTP